MTTNDDGLLAALKEAVARPQRLPEEEREEQERRDTGNRELLAQLESAVGGRTLALNDDAGLARVLGMPLGHNTHFTN
ncbi:hypothetical protein [Microbacterium sp. zg-YB36]|uniref:hypothetical protein n=1 Tax=Microbacterium sp. zg-YB36 TaxID=2969407 RepID=UPI00214C1BFF|nr:hypothetical protein [Microbacterium sp. zg-YB36]MDL5350560.1 hypothetical protein [Microbacterium sp. zg-YB36]